MHLSDTVGAEGLVARWRGAEGARRSYTENCATPVIEVRRNAHHGFFTDNELREVMKQHPEEASQLVAYEAHLKSGYALLVTAKDMALLERLVERWRGVEKSNFRCFDVASHAPDPYTPSPQLRRVFFHPWSASKLELF